MSNHSQPITKEMWTDIEKEMTNLIVDVKFRYKGHEITVQREYESESKSSLAVYIDGTIKGVWVSVHNDENAKALRPAICDEVWRLRTKSNYTTEFIKKAEKAFGKRRIKTAIPDLYDKHKYRWPWFSKASVLCRQLKKIEGIELVSGVNDYLEISG